MADKSGIRDDSSQSCLRLENLRHQLSSQCNQQDQAKFFGRCRGIAWMDSSIQTGSTGLDSGYLKPPPNR